MLAKKVKILTGSVGRCWDSKGLITRTIAGQVLDVVGLPFHSPGNIYYVVMTTDGLRMCVFENEVEVVE